jgi:hypothetical protein
MTRSSFSSAAQLVLEQAHEARAQLLGAEGLLHEVVGAGGQGGVGVGAGRVLTEQEHRGAHAALRARQGLAKIAAIETRQERVEDDDVDCASAQKFERFFDTAHGLYGSAPTLNQLAHDVCDRRAAADDQRSRTWQQSLLGDAQRILGGAAVAVGEMSEPQLVTLFEREAQAVAAIEHAARDRSDFLTDAEGGQQPLAVFHVLVLKRQIRVFRVEGVSECFEVFEAITDLVQADGD